MYKNGVITFSDWQKGQADSPYVGHAIIRNCEIFEKPGALKISRKLGLDITTAGIPVAFVNASDGDKYVLTTNGAGTSTLYKRGVALTNISGTAWDMVEFKGYLIISSSAGLSCYGISTSTAFFSLFKTGFTSTHYIKMLVGQDSILYLTNGPYIASVNPSTWTDGTFSVAPTCTINYQALNLPAGIYAVTMVELGKNLLIGTQAGSSWSARTAQRIANIYPWDRVSTSFNLPVRIAEAGIHAMISINNTIYFLAGTAGNLYVTDGTSYRKARRLPWTVNKAYGNSVSFYPNAITTNAMGNLLIGASINGGVATQLGVFETELTSGNYITVLKNTISTGNFTGISIGCITVLETNKIYVGWQDGSSYGLDVISSDATYTGYKAIAESEVFLVADTLGKKSFTNIQFLLGNPLSASQGLKLYYRKNLSDDYTPIGTYTFATLGAVVSFPDRASISDAEIIQLKVELLSDSQASPPPTLDLELMSVSVW